MQARIHKLWPSWALFIGSFLAFLGERVLSEGQNARMVLALLAGLCGLAALGQRLAEFSRAEGDKKYVAKSLLLHSSLIVVSIGFYVMIPLFFSGEEASDERFRSVIWGIWPVLWALGALPILSLEAAVLSVAFNDSYELYRVRASLRRGLTVSLLLGVLFYGNLLATRHDKKWELSSGARAVASAPTQKAVTELTKPVKVILFWSKANEVRETVERYFKPLTALNSNLVIEHRDQALASELAQKTGVTENGYIAVVQDQSSEKIRVGTKARNSKAALRRLDQNFLKALIKVVTTKKVAYFTTGHGERAFKSKHREDLRPPVTLMRRQLEAWQFEVKPLGVGEGLTERVPKDATVIFIVGPEKPFLPAEVETLKKAMEKGVRILVALEAEREGDTLAPLLEPLGLKFDKTLLANQRTNAPLTKTKADNYHIWSNRYASHASVTTMTRNSKLATVFGKTGSLARFSDPKLKGFKTDMVLSAVLDTFQDTNLSATHDEGEKKSHFGLAAVATKTSTTGKKKDETRIFVLADADVLSDKLIKMIQGNAYLFGDIVYWLKIDEQPVVPTITEKDVRIVHKKEEDNLIFYGTTFGIPVLVLLLGVIANRRKHS